MADTSQHALVLRSNCDIALLPKRDGPLAAMVTDALSLALEKEPSDDTKPSVLLADDDRALVEYLAELLAPNFAVASAIDASEACEMILASDYDVIVANVALRQVSGGVVYSRIEEAKPHLCERFIFTEAAGQREPGQSFVENAPCVLLRKPVRLDQWDNALLSVLKRVRPARFRSVESVFLL